MVRCGPVSPAAVMSASRDSFLLCVAEFIATVSPATLFHLSLLLLYRHRGLLPFVSVSAYFPDRIHRATTPHACHHHVYIIIRPRPLPIAQSLTLCVTLPLYM